MWFGKTLPKSRCAHYKIYTALNCIAVQYMNRTHEYVTWDTAKVADTTGCFCLFYSWCIFVGKQGKYKAFILNRRHSERFMTRRWIFNSSHILPWNVSFWTSPSSHSTHEQVVNLIKFSLRMNAKHVTFGRFCNKNKKEARYNLKKNVEPGQIDIDCHYLSRKTFTVIAHWYFINYIFVQIVVERHAAWNLGTWLSQSGSFKCHFFLHELDRYV